MTPKANRSRLFSLQYSHSRDSRQFAVLTSVERKSGGNEKRLSLPQRAQLAVNRPLVARRKIAASDSWSRRNSQSRANDLFRRAPRLHADASARLYFDGWQGRAFGWRLSPA